MDNYYANLRFETPTRVKFRGSDVFRLRVTVTDAVGLPTELFLVRNTLVDATNELTVKQEFQAICSVFDLSAYPANSPHATQSPPFFRVATIDIPLPNLAAADTVIEDIKTQVAALCADHELLDTLEVVEEVWLPGTPTTTTTTPHP